MSETGLLAVVRIRGSPGLDKPKKDTLNMLNLTRVNHCVVIREDPSYIGMLRKVENYVTWGEITKETLEKLVLKRGRLTGNKKIEPEKVKKITETILKEKSVKNTPLKPVFRLHPPKKGYKSIKVLYPKGDAGYRGEKINELLKRMI